MLDGPLGINRAAVIGNLGFWILKNIGRENGVEFGPRLFARQPIKCLFEGASSTVVPVCVFAGTSSGSETELDES